MIEAAQVDVALNGESSAQAEEIREVQRKKASQARKRKRKDKQQSDVPVASGDEGETSSRPDPETKSV